MQRCHVYYIKNNIGQNNQTKQTNTDRKELEENKPGIIRLPKKVTFSKHNGNAIELIPPADKIQDSRDEDILLISTPHLGNPVSGNFATNEESAKSEIINDMATNELGNENQTKTSAYQDVLLVSAPGQSNSDNNEEQDDPDNDVQSKHSVDPETLITSDDSNYFRTGKNDSNISIASLNDLPSQDLKEGEQEAKQSFQRPQNEMKRISKKGKTPERKSINFLTKRMSGKPKRSRKKMIVENVPDRVNNLHIPQFFSSSDKKIMLRTNLFNKFISFELDTGASTSVLSHDILSAINQNYEKNLKKYKASFILTGVTGNNLEIYGLYRLPLSVPNVGTVYVKVAVVKEPNIRLLGRDFFYTTGLSLIFNGSGYKLSFDERKMKKDGPEEGLIFNENEIKLDAKQSKYEVTQISNFPRGEYEAKLLDRPPGIVMPRSIIKITKRNGMTRVRLALGNTSNDEISIPRHGLRIKIVKVDNENVNYLGYKDISTELLKREIVLNQGDCDLEGLEAYYQPKVKVTSFAPQQFQINKVCLKCVEEEVTFETIAKVHNGHTRKDGDMGKADEITTEEQEVGGFPEFDVPFQDIVQPLEDRELMNGELSVPIPPTEEEIKIEIDNICEKYPPEINQLLRPVLEKNQRLLKNAYDLPVCKESLHFELKEKIKKNTKVYPIKPGVAENFFSTLQFMVYYGILRRAEAHESFGAPTFAIERKAPAGTDKLTYSKPVRILCDLRQNNQCIANSVSACMSSCLDILRTLAQDCKYLTLLDISNCFYSVPMSKEVLESGYNNILTPWGAFICTRALSGNSIVPSFVTNYLQKKLFMDSEGVSQFLAAVYSFYDDISVKSFKGESKMSHFAKVALVIERITEAGFQLNLAKSFYCVDMEQESLEVLGYKVSCNKLQVTEKRKSDIAAVLNKPKTLKQLQKITGVLNYVRTCLDLTELRSLSKLSTFSVKNTLAWTPEGDKILEELKESIMKSEMKVLVPPRNCINILYTDSSTHTIAGMLFFCPLSIFESTDGFPVVQPRDELIDRHISKFEVPCEAITKVVPKIIEFCTLVYYTYNNSINPSDDNIVKMIMKELICMTPILLKKFESPSELQEMIRGIEKTTHVPLSEQYILHSLSRILGRPIIMMINLGYDQKVPYIVEGNYDGLSPALVSITNNGYQLHGLTKDYDEQKRFSRVTIDQLSATAVQGIFQKGYKDSLFTFGGCFGRRLPDSFKSSPIHNKELCALWEGLKYFSSFVQMRHTVAVMDNSIVVHSLKSYKNRENNKLFRLGMSIGSDYPNLRICLCSTANMKADILTRLYEQPPTEPPEPMPIIDLSTYIDKVKIDDSVVKNSACDIKGKNREESDKEEVKELKINYVSPLTFKYGFEQICSLDNIAIETRLGHPEMLQDTNYTLEEGILKNKVTGRIFLPHKLYGPYILKEHVTQGHEGQIKLMETVRNKFEITNLGKLRSETKILIGACMSCVSAKATFQKKLIFDSNYGNEIGKSISIDIVEFNKKVKLSKGQYNILGILIVLDNVTGYTSCYYLSEFTTGAVINSLLAYFSVQPIPRTLLSDNASIFSNNKFSNFLRLFNIRQVSSAPLHSESRGKVERSIGHFRQFSRIFQIQMPNVRPELSYVFATKFKNGNKIKGLPVSPKFLNNYQDNNYIYKKDFKSSILNDVDAKIALGTEVNAETERIQASEMYEKAMKIKSKLHEERMAKINKNKFNHKFTVGAVVAIKNFDRKSKHQPMYLFEPYMVLEVRRKLLIVESLISGVIKKRHVAQAKMIGSVTDLNIPKDILIKNKFYGPEMLEIMREGYLKDKAQVSKRATRSKTVKQDTDTTEEEFQGLGDNDSDDDRHVHFELA